MAKAPQFSWNKAALGGIALAVTILLGFLLLSGGKGGSQNLRSLPEKFRIAIIADLDKLSKKTGADGKAIWHSKYMTGSLTRAGEKYSIVWDPPSDVVTGHNEAGRGCELSELVRFNGRLYTFDDRTGIMFEIQNPENSGAKGDHAPFLAPRHIFMEGDGDTDKGLKVEWATVRDDKLYVGSFGKEFTGNNGEILHSNNLWVVVLGKDGTYANVNWTEYYTRMRRALGYEHPGYLLHEAVVWSPHHKRWYVLPRRMSREAYNDVLDERRGANTVISASPDFSSVSQAPLGTLTPERGFSTAKFLPGSEDRVIIALKSAEDAAKDEQTAFLAIYGEGPDGQWRTLLEETEIPGKSKFEGLEVLSWGN